MARKEKIYALTLALLVSFILYGNTIMAGFVYDDALYVKRPELQNIHGLINSFAQPFHPDSPESGLYRPLTVASFAFNYILFGGSPLSFHVVNIILNGFVGFLVFLLAFQLTKNKQASFAALLFYLVLPIHTEAVALIKSRDEILSTLFLLAALFAFLKERVVYSALWFFFALLNKENAIILPGIVLYICVFQNKKTLLEGIKKIYPYTIPIALYAFARYMVLGSYSYLSVPEISRFIYNPLRFVSFTERIATALKITYLYIQKIFIPVNLSSNYYFNQIPIIKYPWQSLEVLAGVCILALCMWLVFKRKIVGLGAAIFLISYLFVSNLIFPITDIMGERFMYFPTVGIAVMIAAWVAHMQGRLNTQRIILCALGVVCVLYSFATIMRNRVWYSNENLYEAAIISSPDSVLSIDNYARLLLDGDKSAAIEEAKKAIMIHRFAPTEHFLGTVHFQDGKLQDAETYFLQAIEDDPKYILSYSGLGYVYYQAGKYDDAIRALMLPITKKWYQGDIVVAALSYIRLGNPQGAIDLIKKYYGENPSDAKLKFTLGVAYFKQGEDQMAKFYFDQSKNPAKSDADIEKFINQNF